MGAPLAWAHCAQAVTSLAALNATTQARQANVTQLTQL